MKRRILVPLAVLVGLFLLAQIFQPGMNLGGEEQTEDLLAVREVPDEVALLMKQACYNCHSNHTEYPWYSRISPISWYLYTHIEKGKDELNLSEFGDMRKRKQLGSLAEICEVLETGRMPLKSYLFMHKEARLSGADKALLCDWSDSLAAEILSQDIP
jgi:hypothetical protein